MPRLLCQAPCRLLDWCSSLGQLRCAIEEPIGDHFLIATGQHPAQLATAPIALLGKTPDAPASRSDKGIVQLLNRCVLHCLLGNLHGLSNGAKYFQLSQFHTQCCQTRTPGKMLRRFRGRFVKDDGPPISGFISFDRYAPPS